MCYLLDRTIENEAKDFLGDFKLFLSFVLWLDGDFLLWEGLFQGVVDYGDQHAGLTAEPEWLDRLFFLLLQLSEPVVLHNEAWVGVYEHLIVNDVKDKLLQEDFVALDSLLRVLGVHSLLPDLAWGRPIMVTCFVSLVLIETAEVLLLCNELVHKLGKNAADSIHVFLLWLKDSVEQLADERVIPVEVDFLKVFEFAEFMVDDLLDEWDHKKVDSFLLSAYHYSLIILKLFLHFCIKFVLIIEASRRIQVFEVFEQDFTCKLSRLVHLDEVAWMAL